MPQTKTFSLYLAKQTVQQHRGVLTENALSRLDGGRASEHRDGNLGEGATLFLFPERRSRPKWLDDVQQVFEGVGDLSNVSSSALVVFEAEGRIFVTSFAHAWQFIDESQIESDFGLRVAINALSDSSVRRVDRNHLGEAIRGVSQSAFKRDLKSFGLEEALDLVRRVSGKVEDSEFASNLAGSTSLRITREMSLAELAGTAAEALTLAGSDQYQGTAFSIIDKIKPVGDRALIDALDQLIVDSVIEGRDNFELSMPAWSEDDIVYFGFVGIGVRGRFSDLLMSNYRQCLGGNLAELSVEKIRKKHGVLAEFSNDALSKKTWPIKRSVVGSVVYEGGLFAISEGEWYRLDEAFKRDVDGLFAEVCEQWDREPLVIIKIVSEDGKRTGFESELSYNRRCAEVYGELCLDQEIVSVPDVSFGKFEVCDLLDIGRKRLVHVKKSSRQSSVLSHFLKQGSNSARILKTFPQARQAAVGKIRERFGERVALDAESAFGDGMRDWKVEFHIIDAVRADGEFRIPFFSRITLQEEARLPRGMGYSVGLRFIRHPE
ncbi:TIGR04141 family sporadically distributed protein [Albimonas sp. CAU 1670]|uniref:DUF6119 family protein n=1 Tax=Albimonas sp. CAU 1670 TaxID=3032599 RepID=UPI0023DB52B4|nr:DUF6119 family protein [Albimonas sp. CAU 1670]MDF2232443.1 TIGR04141 family sporadically distributed protein [Albimonas sp. CAU 1670]